MAEVDLRRVRTRGFSKKPLMQADEQLEFPDAEEEVAGPPPVIANPYRQVLQGLIPSQTGRHRWWDKFWKLSTYMC